MCKENVTINSYRDMLNNGQLDRMGRLILIPNRTYTFNTSIKLNGLVLSGETELKGKHKGISLTLTNPGVSISTYSLSLLTLRNLRINSSNKGSLFDLVGKTVRVNNCDIKSKSLGRLNLESFSLHDVNFTGFEMGFTIVKLDKFIGKFLKGKNLIGPFIDMSITRSLCNLKLRNIRFSENLRGDLELVRVETKSNSVLYRSFNIEDLSLFDLNDINITVKGVNSCKTILDPCDKIITGYSYDSGGFIYQPFRFMNKIALQTVSANSPYG